MGPYGPAFRIVDQSQCSVAYLFILIGWINGKPMLPKILTLPSLKYVGFLIPNDVQAICTNKDQKMFLLSTVCLHWEVSRL